MFDQECNVNDVFSGVAVHSTAAVETLNSTTSTLTCLDIILLMQNGTFYFKRY